MQEWMLDGEGGSPLRWQWMLMRKRWDECLSVLICVGDVRVAGVGRGDLSEQTSALSGKPSMQEGMMDGDGWVAPTWTHHL